MSLRRNSIVTVDGTPFYDDDTVAAAQGLAATLTDRRSRGVHRRGLDRDAMRTA